MGVLDVVVGRQPVFDRDLEIVGYELLFRPVADSNSTLGEVDGDLMTSAVLFSSVSIGIDRLVGDKTVFCNADRGLLVGSQPIILPPERTIIEVHGSIATDPEALAGCHRLYDEGFLIALDDFTGVEGAEVMLELASMVKIDLQLVPEEDLAGLIESCRGFGVLLAAERVETDHQLHLCRALGFDYFQGYQLSRPKMVPGKALAVYSMDRLRGAKRLLDEGRGAADLLEVIATEPAMAYQVLQMAAVGNDTSTRRAIRTLRESLVVLGARQLENCVRLLLTTTSGVTSEDEVVAALTRARMCELLAAQIDPKLAEMAYTAGLLSSFDLLLGISIEEALLALPLDSELLQACLRKPTPVGRIVADVTDYQLGRPERARRSLQDQRAMHAAAATALSWAVEAARGAGAALVGS
ncbi:MAG: EAL domain-containing protein [Actinomycetota bacterium]|nr:EAL domain-containing protein [Actinomycetota bacterium]